MKTICPHCKQEFSETPDEYLGMTLQCSVCQKEFICEKAKFCSECGTLNYAKAIKCSKCGNFFQTIPQRPITPQKDFAYDDIEEVENVPWYKRTIFKKREKIEYEANTWGLLAIFLSFGSYFVPVLILPTLIYALFVRASKGQRYIAMAIILLRMTANVVLEASKLYN